MANEKTPGGGSGAPLLDLSQFEPDRPKTDEEILGRLKPERPEWRHWLKMTVVTIKEALWLSVDIEPRSMAKHASFGEVSGAFVEIKEYYGRLQVV
ncbi:hypothetical protein [Methylovulum psychrotolerans]|uniref:Uncharacterized protein n=1 Tax=Methylovulum psychrotolerans TaxID=1704499 RepID=A0A2S5CLH8_9GAMM|nr:hypothetical protein [Methylovulum psychrotolerans]POZ51673.1 hypothetical protein AADEFJLK_02543 [Methylovulum psychrotolerans]